MKKIEIDIEIYRLIESNRLSFEESENEILKRILLNTKKSDGFIPVDVQKHTWVSGGGLLWKGVFLKNGLKLQKEYKGQLFKAEVINNQIVFNNSSFHSPSAAAIAVTGTSVNGWVFWEYFNSEKNEWEILDKLRKK
jgi:hypothetical protein